MKKSTDLKGGGICAYSAPDVSLIAIAAERGFAGSTSEEAFYDSQDGITGEDYIWGGALDGEFD